MLLNPPIDTLIKKVGNQYKLAIVVSKRAKSLTKTLTVQEKEECPVVTRAVTEVYTDKITD